jgi:L-serine dehydratase
MIPSIFNDVIGPVMRGPSSSHCAAALRIGRLARDLMDGDLEEIAVAFDAEGSLATTHESQGSDMGLFGGLLGWEPTDDRLADSARALVDAGVRLSTRITDLEVKHPSAYRLTLRRGDERHDLTAISTGGGMVEIVEIDGFSVSLVGDYYETLIYAESGGPAIVSHLAARAAADEVALHRAGDACLVEVKGQAFVDDVVLKKVEDLFDVRWVKRLSPVLPILSRARLAVPFATCDQMLAFRGDRDLRLWQLAQAYESARGGIDEGQVLEQTVELVRTLRRSVQQGLQGTDHADRILGCQSGALSRRMADGSLLDGGMLNRIIAYVTALMEVKSAMGVIVAAPTAGACGALPGACLGAGDALGLGDEDVARAMLAGGMIGVFIATSSTFAAEVAGCQAECGAASGMTAAALATMGGGTTDQAVAAASIALQNVMGMVCDPVANRVEVPCLGKNVMAASNALSCANMALAGCDPVIPLDEVIEAMDRVGRSLPHELRCTALGGLSVTRTSKAIEARLERQKP